MDRPERESGSLTPGIDSSADNLRGNTVDGQIHFTPPEKHGKPWFVGMYCGTIIPGFLKWCRISSIHSIALGLWPKILREATYPLKSVPFSFQPVCVFLIRHHSWFNVVGPAKPTASRPSRRCHNETHNRAPPKQNRNHITDGYGAIFP